MVVLAQGEGRSLTSPTGGKAQTTAGRSRGLAKGERLDILALSVFISVHQQSK